MRKRSSLYILFFLFFFFFGKPTFRDRSRTARFANSGSDTVGSKKEKETDAGKDSGRGAEFSSTFLIYPDHFSFSRKRIGGKTVLSGAKKKIRLYLFLFSEEESNVCEIGHSVFTTFFSSFLPQGALTLGTNPLIIREPERRGGPIFSSSFRECREKKVGNQKFFLATFLSDEERSKDRNIIGLGAKCHLRRVSPRNWFHILRS